MNVTKKYMTLIKTGEGHYGWVGCGKSGKACGTQLFELSPERPVGIRQIEIWGHFRQRAQCEHSPGGGPGIQNTTGNSNV